MDNSTLFYLLPNESILVASTLAGLCLCITIPAIIRSLKMYRLRDTPYIKHRGIHLSLLCVGTLVFFIQIAAPLFLIADSHVWGTSIAALLACRMIAATSLYTFVVLFLCRCWLIHFTIHRNNLAENMKWGKFIVEEDFLSTNWYIQHEQTLGNSKFLAKVAVVFGIIIGLVKTSIYYGVRERYASVFEVTMISIFFASFIYLSFCTPKFADMWGIRAEISFVTKTIAVEVLLIGVSVVIAYLFCISFVLVFIFAISFGFLWIPAVWRMTSSSLESNSLSLWDYLDCWCIDDCCPICPKDPHLAIEMADQVTPSSIHGIVLETLADPSLFFEFANHLCEEFAIESILYLVEVTQFQIYLRDTVEAIAGTSHSTSILNLAGYGMQPSPRTATCNVLEIDWREHEMPHSAIVFSPVLTDYEKAKALYEKYVAVGAPFEVNISYPSRNNLTMIFGDSEDEHHAPPILTAMDLFDMFNSVTMEILQLLRDSQVRFRGRRVPSPMGSPRERVRLEA